MTTRLEQLQKKRDQLNARIQSESAKLQAKQRKEDTRKKILIGAMIAKAVEDSEVVMIQQPTDLTDMLDRYLTTKKDRSLFGLQNDDTGDKIPE